jgi:hypothetical protein
MKPAGRIRGRDRPGRRTGLSADETRAFGVCEAHHLRVTDVFKCVDLIAWDNLRMGMGYRTRRRGDYVLVLQKPPITATTWSDHGIPSRWPERIDRKIHPHVKPAGLIARLVGAVTQPGDLVVDPAAGSFVVMHVAIKMGRQFSGCDKAYRNREVCTFDSDCTSSGNATVGGVKQGVVLNHRPRLASDAPASPHRGGTLPGITASRRRGRSRTAHTSSHFLGADGARRSGCLGRASKSRKFPSSGHERRK